jgi:cell division topological specificity factor
MKTLFADIYNKIRELFQIEKSENTSECATNRLQVILMHDRTKLDPLIMNKMREELIDVFSKYVVIDKEELEIGLKNEGDAVALMLNIPIIRAKTEEELNEIRKKLQEEEEKVSDDEEETDEETEEKSEESDEEPEEEKSEDTEDNIVEAEETEIVEETTPVAPSDNEETIVEAEEEKEPESKPEENKNKKDKE